MPLKVHRKNSYCVSIFFCLVVLVLSARVSGAREITDMAGRKVVVPDVIKKVVAPSYYGFAMLCSVAPEKMGGVVAPWGGEDKKFLNPVLHNLPVIGRRLNVEALEKTKPDVILVWGDKKDPIHKPSEDALGKLNIPYVYVTIGNLTDLRDYPAAYRFLGNLLNVEERTAKEAAYCQKAVDEAEAVIRKIPENLRPKVYYAEGADGLLTECDDSLHVHLLKLAGDVNVHRCHTSSHMGMEKVSLEQVDKYNPDVIIAQENGFFDNVRKDPLWSKIKAVKEDRVYLIPKLPFNWFDRPPSFMGIIGLKWLMNCLYPKEYKVDLVQEAQAFYSLFLDVNISADDAEKIISP